MAELNELLHQAVGEAEDLSMEALRAQETIDRMLRLGTSLGDGIEAGSAEAQRRLELLAGKLAEAEAELIKDNAAAVAGLQGVQLASGELSGQVGEFLRRIRSDLAELRAEKDRVLSEVDQAGETARASVLGYSARVKDLEAASETRLAEARKRIATFREEVDTVRGTVGERREALLAAISAFELSARQRLDVLVQTYDALAAVVEDQVGEVQATLKSLSEQLAAGVNRKLAQEALEALATAVEPVKDSIADLDSFCKRSQATCSEKFGEISEKMEEVTRTLDRMRQPLDMVRQYLR